MYKYLLFLIYFILGCGEQTSTDYNIPGKQLFSLNDFELKITKVQKKASIFFQVGERGSLNERYNEQEFFPDSGLTIITLELTAKEAGEINLSTLLFIMQGKTSYERCYGIKFIEPKQDFDRFTLSNWSESPYIMPVSAGQTLIIELAFIGKFGKGQSLLVASQPLVLTNITND